MQFSGPWLRSAGPDVLRLEEPRASFDLTIETCLAGIRPRSAILARLAGAKRALLEEEGPYRQLGTVGALYTVAPFGGAQHGVVIGGATKSDLIKAYGQYFVPEPKPARQIYDSILNSAKEQCPFCCGVGIPRTLDHYLPKTRHPKFSVLPINLIPACRDCNLGQKALLNAAEDWAQVLHPYLDKDVFFEEQWVAARYVDDVPGGRGRIEYFVDAPARWDSGDVARARFHFSTFDLARRFAVNAAAHLPLVQAQITILRRRGLSALEIRSSLLAPGIENAPSVNHWQRPMYQALDAALDIA